MSGELVRRIKCNNCNTVIETENTPTTESYQSLFDVRMNFNLHGKDGEVIPVAVGASLDRKDFCSLECLVKHIIWVRDKIQEKTS